jgi:energy-coupling factor transporter ATP-binding protein EcfA2
MEVTRNPIHKLATHVGLVFQNPENQLFALSVEKDVAFGLENLGMPREEMRKRVNWALNLTGIYPLKERAPNELSGGQQQRVAIAAVLAMQPDVIILDEPTSFLDPLGAKKIFEVIYELNQDFGTTIVLVEHRLDLTAKFADKIIVMNKGKVVLDGNPQEIFAFAETRLIGVGIPKVTLLYQILRNNGLSLGDTVPLSAIDMANMLREAIKKDD